MRHVTKDQNRRAVGRAYRRALRRGHDDAVWLAAIYANGAPRVGR